MKLRNARPKIGACVQIDERSAQVRSGAKSVARASEHGFVRPSVRIPDAAFQVALLSAHESWMAGQLVYCDPFWAADCVGLRDPDLAELEARFA